MGLIESIKRHEGFRNRVYDDATGLPLAPGDVVRGTPTIGYGTTWVNEEMAEELLRAHLVLYEKQVRTRLPWLDKASEEVQDIVLEMAYQMGILGLMQWTNTLGALERRDWAAAIKGLKSSKLAKQAPSRVEDYVAVLRGLAGSDEQNGAPTPGDETWLAKLYRITGWTGG